MEQYLPEYPIGQRENLTYLRTQRLNNIGGLNCMSKEK